MWRERRVRRPLKPCWQLARRDIFPPSEHIRGSSNQQAHDRTGREGARRRRDQKIRGPSQLINTMLCLFGSARTEPVTSRQLGGIRVSDYWPPRPRERQATLLLARDITRCGGAVSLGLSALFFIYFFIPATRTHRRNDDGLTAHQPLPRSDSTAPTHGICLQCTVTQYARVAGLSGPHQKCWASPYVRHYVCSL